MRIFICETLRGSIGNSLQYYISFLNQTFSNKVLYFSCIGRHGRTFVFALDDNNKKVPIRRVPVHPGERSF